MTLRREEHDLVFRVDMPRRNGRLRFSHAVHPDGYERPGIEFTVKVRRGEREEMVFTRLIEDTPLEHRFVDEDSVAVVRRGERTQTSPEPG